MCAALHRPLQKGHKGLLIKWDRDGEYYRAEIIERRYCSEYPAAAAARNAAAQQNTLQHAAQHACERNTALPRENGARGSRFQRSRWRADAKRWHYYVHYTDFNRRLDQWVTPDRILLKVHAHARTCRSTLPFPPCLSRTIQRSAAAPTEAPALAAADSRWSLRHVCAPSGVACHVAMRRATCSRQRRPRGRSRVACPTACSLLQHAVAP